MADFNDANDDLEFEENTHSPFNFDIHTSRCSGLMERKAIRKKDNQKVYAENVTKTDGPFYCPVCLSEAIVRKCSEKIDHFAHHAKQSPILRKKDKELHNKCRLQLLNYLIVSFPQGNWAAEREIPAKTSEQKNIIPDISGRIGDLAVAIEVQVSTYTLNRIYEKLVEYNKRKTKIAVLYVIPLREDIGNEPFRPRLFEKYLHSLYFGRVYYWLENSSPMLSPVHFSPAKRWIESSTWFDKDIKETRTEGGFYLTYRTIKTPNVANLIDIASGFQEVNRKEFVPKNVKKALPNCTIFKDKLNSWWDKMEYKNLNNQHTVINENNWLEFLSGYDSEDSYDVAEEEL